MDLNLSFKGTCRVLFGREIGSLDEFAPYLSEMVRKPYVGKSYVSGKDVYFVQPHYGRGAKFISADEVAGKTGSVGINQVKDIDSIMAALSEMAYCGNRQFGISANLSSCDTCTDCTNLHSCPQSLESKNCAYDFALRKGEGNFGCSWCGEAPFSMRSGGLFYSSRCFESYLCVKSNDLAFSFNCRSCDSCMFCFNQSGKRNAIGNVEMQKEKFTALKAKLLSEVAEDLAKRKSYPSLFQLVGDVA